MRLADDVVVWPRGDDLVLWHRGTGRALAVSPHALAALPDALRQRMRALGLFHGDGPDLAALIPCRSRLPLLRPGPSTNAAADVGAPAAELWHPVPAARTAGGHGWRPLALDAGELALWRQINDARTVVDIARRAGVAVDRALAFLRRLTSADVQAVQLRDKPASARDPSLERLVAPPRPANARPDDQRGGAGETTLTAYHLAITDGERHFDDRETTVAHAHGTPHPALGGRRFGEALADALGARGWWTGGLVAEIGCGDGELAEALLARLGGVGTSGGAPASSGSGIGRYLRVDLSPELLRTQAKRVPATWGVVADGTRLPLRDRSVDVVVSNEVIADLTAVPWDGSPPAPGTAAADVAARVARYGLRPLPGAAFYNLGAWRLVEEIARVLRPGGHAYVSEFGGDDAPEEAVQLDHPEVSIHFGQLADVARGCGLTAEVVRMDELLGFDLSARQLWRAHHEGLRAMMRAERRHLPARAWTPETLADALPWPVEGLRWVSVAEEGAGPLVTRFQCLLLGLPVLEELPEDARPPARVVLDADSAERVREMLQDPAAPTEAMKKLFDER